MNNDPTLNPASAAPDSAIDLVIESRARELGDGFKVRRVLPHRERRMVGPFIFLDEMGPEILTAGTGLDVAPHPHIGLATVTYLFSGEIMHRDGLGTQQLITPGAVNWMTAGSGIAHSERSPQEARTSGSSLFGIQTWVALPEAYEEVSPEFFHNEADELPVIEGEGKTVRVIAGSLYGQRSPVKTFSDTIQADVSLMRGAKLPVSAETEERAVYIVEGQVEFLPRDGTFGAGQLVILKPGFEATLSCVSERARLMLFGGASLGGKRHIWWNFVSSSQERIEQAKQDWREQRFAPVPEEKTFIPLPEEPKPDVVRYP